MNFDFSVPMKDVNGDQALEYVKLHLTVLVPFVYYS